MKLKSVVLAALVAVSGANAFATTTLTPVQTNGPSFTNLSIGNIVVSGGPADILGSVFAVDTFQATLLFGGTVSFSLQPVTFTGTSAGSLIDYDTSPAGFNFKNVAAGSYMLKASGTLSGPGQIPNVAFIGATYNVTPVPEPETYAMMLAGLAALGFLARRRQS